MISKKNSFFLFIYFISLCSNGQEDYNSIIDDYLSRYEYDSAAYVTQKAIKDNKKENYQKAAYYIQYTKILKSLSKADSCFYFLDKAELIYEQDKKNYQEKIFYILTLKAEIARYLNKRKLAETLIYEASQLEKESFNINTLAYFYNRKMAIIATYYNNIPDSVIVVKKLADKIIDKQDYIKDKSLVVYTLNEIGFLDFNKNPTIADFYFKRALDVAQKNNCKVALVDVYINLGRLYQSKFEKYPIAIDYNKKALAFAKEINNNWQAKEAILNLRNCYELMKNYETAMRYSDSVSHYIVKNIEEEKKLFIEELEKKYNYQNQERELLVTKKNNYYLITVLFISFLGIFVLIFYSKKIQQKNKLLEKLHQENQFLISETNHRVNNSLQLISLLITDTLRKKQSEENKDDFMRILSKIETIASLHRHLYKNKDQNKIVLCDYLSEIKTNFNEIAADKNVVIDFNIDDFQIHSENAMYLGLLITELIINSIKYAFTTTQEKIILVTISIVTQGYSFEYQDNGKTSLNKDIQPKLIHQLCLQLDVAYKINTANGFQLSFVKKQ